jgi:hypothetical protein
MGGGLMTTDRDKIIAVLGIFQDLFEEPMYKTVGSNVVCSDKTYSFNPAGEVVKVTVEG